MSSEFEQIARDWNAVRPKHIYSRLFTAIAAEPSLQTLVRGAREGQQYGILLMGVLRYLTDDVVSEPLSRWFASPELEDDPVPAFRDLVARRRPEIERLVATRTVQTNEPRRAVALMPALALVEQEAGAPLALIEPGCSAGLNLNLDRYAYDDGFASVGSSTLTLTTEVRGDVRPPVPDEVPRIAWRAGIDTNPPDVTNEDDVRWLRSFIWPGDDLRVANHIAATEIARAWPPPIVTGDVFEMLAPVVADAPADLALVVMHSMLCEHFTPEMRARLTALIASLRRPLWWISFELNGVMPVSDAFEPDPRRAGLEGERGTLLRLVRFTQDGGTERLLALAHPHGRWLRWL